MHSARRPTLLPLLLVVLPALAPAPPARAADDTLHRLDAALQQVVARVSPAVVQVQVNGYSQVEGPDGVALTRQRTLGSGVIIDGAGYVVTNQHVVRGAQRIRVLLPADALAGGAAGPQRLFEARLVGAHAETDLALLKIEAQGLHALPLGSARALKAGQLVWAVGSPQGLASTVTMGVISSVARQTDFSGPLSFIQTDAPINPGNSGGPLIDADGAVIGINTFILSQSGGSQGLGFAIHIDIVKFVAESLRRTGQVRRIELGITTQHVTPTLAAGLGLPRDYGVIISDAIPGGPSATAGVLPGDLVERIDGRAITSMPELAVAIYLHPLGQPLKLEVRRGGTVKALLVEGAPVDRPGDRLQALVTPEQNLVARLGVLAIGVEGGLPELAQTLRRRNGVVVAARMAEPGSAENGLQAGDVIDFVNQRSVSDLSELRAAVDAIRPGGPVVLTVERQGKLTYLSFEME